MGIIIDSLKNIVELWPIFLVTFGIVAAGVKVMIRAETKLVEKATNEKLYGKNGKMLYVLRDEYDEEVVRMITDMNIRCQDHRDSCKNTLCMKIDGVLVKLKDMDEQREEARKERNVAIDKHSEKLEHLGKEMSKMTGRFDTLEKTVLNNGGRK